MRELYELKDKLMDELKEYGKKEMSSGTLEVVDKLTHTLKNLDKIIESFDGGESGYRGYSRDHAYTRRDSMGRYSRDGLADKLRSLLHDAPDEHTRNEIQRLIDKM